MKIGEKIGSRSMRAKEERNARILRARQQLFPAPVGPGMVDNKIRLKIFQKNAQIFP